jgi:hypothetical protein
MRVRRTLQGSPYTQNPDQQAEAQAHLQGSSAPLPLLLLMAHLMSRSERTAQLTA